MENGAASRRWRGLTPQCCRFAGETSKCCYCHGENIWTADGRRAQKQQHQGERIVIARAGRRRAIHRRSSRCGACVCTPPLHRLRGWRRAAPRLAMATPAAAWTNAIAESVECVRALDERVTARGSDAAAVVINSMRGRRGCGWRGDPTSLSRCGEQPGGTTDSTPWRASRTASRRTNVLAKNTGQASERGKQRRSQTKSPAKCSSPSPISLPRSPAQGGVINEKKSLECKASIVWHRWRNWPPQQGTRRHPHQKKLFTDSCKKARRWEDASPGAPAST